MSEKSFNEIKKKLFRGKSPDGLPISPGGARIGHHFYTYYVTRGNQSMLVKVGTQSERGKTMVKYLTNQEIFNKVSKHLIAQGKQCVTKDGDCVYRGPKNLKCAIGCLIPDKSYVKDMEGSGASYLFRDYPVIMEESKLKKQSLQLLHYLQRAHDDSFEDLKPELKRCAQKFRLNSKVLGEV